MAGNPASQPSVGAQLQKDDAWARAKDTYAKQRKKLKETDLIDIIGSDGPQDLASFIERIQNEKGAYAKTVGAVNKCLGFLKEREGPIDLLAQAGGSPGCLAWGLIKWALQMVRGYTEEYEKLIEALANICEWLKPIRLDAATFAHSENVQECIVRIYGITLTFWEKAILAYTPVQKKRHRIFHLAKATWVDFDQELSTLKDAFANQCKIFEDNARAVHHQETKEGQHAMLSGIEDAAQIARRREIAAWLGPPKDAPYGNDFYKDDLEAQLEHQHPGTCKWIFDNSDFLNWRKGSSTEYQPALYLASGPGGGKSVLTATVVDELLRSQPGRQIPVFYFFFVNTDRNKNSSIALARSLLYQIYHYGRSDRASKFDELEMSLETHATENVRSLESIWTLFKNYLDRVSRAYVVIDALDECVDPPALFHALSNLQKSAGLFVSGRVDVAEQCQKLRELRQVDIGVVEASKDIEHFLQKKRKGAFKPELRQKTINAVLAKARGMFLWVTLVAQALESLIDATEIDKAIASLPDDLYAAYDNTLERMAASMKNQAGKRKLCRNALQWLACSERAMSVHELFTALSIGFKSEDILFTQEAVISACGPLAVVQQNTIQLVHFSTKEYLTSRHLANSAQCRFYVDPKQTNISIARACTEYIRSVKVGKLFPVERNSDEHRLIIRGIDTSLLARESLKGAWRDHVNAELPFAEYAVLYWLPHLQASSYGLDDQNKDTSISNFLKSHSTLVWIELYSTINCQRSDLEKLSVVVGDCFPSLEGMPTLEVAWRHAVLAVLHAFGKILLLNPNEARHLDPTILAQYDAELLKWQNGSEVCYEKHMVLGVDSAESQPNINSKQHLYLPPGGDVSSRLGFLHFHRQSKSLLFADQLVEPGACAWLYCQNAESGCKSKPFLIVSSPSTLARKLEGTGICKDSKHLCLFYTSYKNFKPHGNKSMVLLQINLDDDSTISNWATLLFTQDGWWPHVGNIQVTSQNIYVGGRTYNLKDGECVQDIDVPSEIEDVGPIFYYADGAMLFPAYAPITEDDATDTTVESRESSFYSYLGRRVTLRPGQIIQGLSNDGRYVLVSIQKGSRWEKHEFDIFDTFLNQDHLGEQYMPFNGAFYGGDEWLINFGMENHVTRYHLPSLFSGSHLGLSVRGLDGGRFASCCINDVEKEAYVVRNRKWYRLDLNSLEWKDKLPQNNTIQPNYTKISADGRRLAIIDPTNRPSRIQIFDLQSGLLDREYDFGLFPNFLPTSTLGQKLLSSPDLRIWRISKSRPGYLFDVDDGNSPSTRTIKPGNLYHLDDGNSPSTRTVKAFHVPETYSDGLGVDRIDGDCFSTCGKYFGFWWKNDSTRGASGGERYMKIEITILELDLVHSNVKVHSRIPFTRPSRESAIIKFHPRLSMLAILFAKHNIGELYLHDLQTLKTDLAWSAEWTKRIYVRPVLGFDEYGIFVIPEDPDRQEAESVIIMSSSLDQIKFTDRCRDIPSLPLSARIVASSQHLMYYNYKFFLPRDVLMHSETHLALVVNRFRDLSTLLSLSINPEGPITRTNMRRRSQRRPIYYLTCLQDFERYYSSHTKLYLLLGNTARSKLRLLSVFENQPPELKFLDLSWHDMIMDIDDYFANGDANHINDADDADDPATFWGKEIIPRNYNRKTEEQLMPLRTKN